jgi:hypothetical protein
MPRSDTDYAAWVMPIFAGATMLWLVGVTIYG